MMNQRDRVALAQAIAQSVTESVLTVLDKQGSNGDSRPKRKCVIRKVKPRVYRAVIIRKAKPKSKVKPITKFKRIIRKIKTGKKKFRKVSYDFVKAKMVTNKCLFVLGLIKNRFGELRKVQAITLGPGDRAWVYVDNVKDNKEDLVVTKKPITKFRDDKMQPPAHKFGEYIKHTTTFGEGAEMKRYQIHPNVSEDLTADLAAFRAVQDPGSGVEEEE